MAGGSGGGGSGSSAGGASLLSIGLSAYGDVEKGAGQNAADQFQADRATEAAKFGRLKADLADTTALEKINIQMGNIDAIRAAAHIDPTSPTTQAVEGWQTEIMNRQRLATVGTEREQAATDEASAAYLKQAGQFAQQQSYLQAGIDVATGIGKAFLPTPTGTG
jgi:hypothetical protein